MSGNSSGATNEPKPGSVRRRNLGVVLRVLRTSGPQTRAELVVATDLAKATVASLVGDLLSAELITELEVRYTGQTGRPSRRLAISGEWVVGVGVAIHEDRLVGVATDLTGRRVDALDVRVDPGPVASDQLIDELTGFIASFVERLLAAGQPSGRLIAGLCVTTPPPGEVGHLGRSRPPSTVDLVELGRRLSSVAGLARDLPVSSLPEASAAALAEQHHGGFGANANLISIGGHGGLGAGVILDGELRLGHTGTLGRAAHLVINPLGGRCPCGGRGCWGTVIGLDAIVADIAPELMADPSTGMGPDRWVAEILARANAGDPLALDGLDHAGHVLGLGLASVIAMFDPEVIVLSGYLRALGPWLVPPAEAALGRRWGADATPAWQLQLSSVLGDPAAIGASQWATRLVYQDPLSVQPTT